MHENRRKRRRRISAVAAAIATSLATLVGLVATTAVPAGATSAGPITYEADCAGTGLAVGQVAPFPVTIVGDTTTNSAFPTAATFGTSGNAIVNLSGTFVASLEGNNFGSAGLSADFTLGATNATGSYNLAQTQPAVSLPGRNLATATYTSGSTTVSGNFAAGDVGNFIAGSGATSGIPQGTVITAVNAGVSATISNTTTAGGTGVGLGSPAGQNFTFPFTSPTNAFTTAGVDGDNAGVNVVSAASFTINSTISLTFDGGCTVTGYDAAHNPGPGQSPAPGPLLPDGSVTPLVSVSPVVTAPFATVALVDAPPVAQDASYNLGVGQSKTITLIATDTDATPVTGFSIVGSPSDARLTVGSPAANGDVTITDTGSGPAIVTFQFTATDGVGTSNTATATVNIGTPPVDEPLTQNVNGGQLVLSCSNPDTNGGTPALICPEFPFNDITLNGLPQTTTGTGATLYVSDNRGDPTATAWSLTASMVATPIGVGSNTNASCSGIVAFCNANVGTHALDASGNGQIAKSNLSIGSITCAAHAGNLNPDATAGTGGSFATTQQICQAVSSTQQGGTFDVTKNYTLTIPSSVYAGKYWGTVEFLVQ